MIEFPRDSTGSALKEYQENGSDMTKPMVIDFFISVPTKKVGKKIAKVVRDLGFNPSLHYDDEFEEWTCNCTLSLIPNYEEVTKIERKLSDVATKYGGYIDGFGSYGNAEM